MYFLDGNRIYVEPENKNEMLEEQLENCFSQISKINSGKEVFKVNFFADTSSEEAYQELKHTVKRELVLRYTNSIIIDVIAQPPLTCKIIAEVFYYDTSLWSLNRIKAENYSAAVFEREGTKIMVGNVQVDTNKSFRDNVSLVFDVYGEVFKQAGFPISSIIRQWNYIEDIVGFEGKDQRYQIFNNVRSDFYSGYFSKTGYPAATGIGMNHGGVLIEFIAVSSENVSTQPLDNPDQIAAHDYSKNVLVGIENELKSTPKFERARYLKVSDRKMIFISGTASIRGENTVGIGDPEEQTRITIENIQRLYSAEVLSKLSDVSDKPEYGHARVYVKNRSDFSAIKRTFENYYGKLPVVYILADICRDKLLVEIEGKVIIK